MKSRIGLTLIVAATMLVSAAAARADARNTLQPSNVYFGRVTAGEHPERVVNVANHTGRREQIRRFLIAGAGGEKFTLVRHKGSYSSTCRVGMILADRASCTIIVRVKTTTPEWWQSVIDVFYGPKVSIGSASMVTPPSGVWNGAVYAHVV